MFRIGGRQMRFTLALPDRKDPAFTTYYRGRQRFERTASAADEAWGQACRQKWRALALVIKAKLEAVEVGITTVEDEFLAATILPDGATVSQWISGDLALAYSSGAMPRRLLIEGPR